MRALLAIAIFAGGLLALDAAAEEEETARSRRSRDTAMSERERGHYARRSERSGKSRSASARDRARRAKARVVCEERARHEDPSGRYASYPCWARESFARGANIDLH
jgi:hypothetical protein